MRRIIAVLMVAGMLGGLAFFVSVPRASAQVGNQGTITLGPTRQGEVTQKFTPFRDTYEIAVNGQPYSVPLGFYDHVEVGTVVKFDGANWSIISGGL